MKFMTNEAYVAAGGTGCPNEDCLSADVESTEGLEHDAGQ